MEVINAACFLCANDTSDQKLMHIQMQQFRRFACTAQQVSFLVSFTIERHCKWHAGTVSRGYKLNLTTITSGKF